MDPQWIIAGAAAVTLIMAWTSSVASVVIWLTKRLDAIKKEILDDSKAKHAENKLRVDAMQELLIRHDTLLNPEFNGRAGSTRHRVAREQ